MADTYGDGWNGGQLSLNYGYFNIVDNGPPSSCSGGDFSCHSISFTIAELDDTLQTIDSPSPYGAYDMAGNVWEIVKNDDDSYFIRGGAYNSDASQLQSWYQESYSYSNIDAGISDTNNIGFRCIRIINQSQSRSVPKEKLKEYYLNKRNNTQKSNLKK